MKVLKIIATPFVALWRWIKETAWVQPLLIVGCIFAIIFSIPYISKGIQNLINKDEDELAYYNAHRLSMNGAYLGATSNDAEIFISQIADVQLEWDDVLKGEKTIDSAEKISTFKNKYGEKFFFVLGKSSCDACSNISDGLEYLENHLGDYGVSSYKLYSIIADQDLDDDDKEYKENTAFEMIYNRQSDAFETMFRSASYGYYRRNIEDSTASSSYQDKVDTLHSEKVSSIEVPVVILFDLSSEALSYEQPYVMSQVFFSLDGDDKVDRALELANCWLYRGDTFKRNSSD